MVSTCDGVQEYVGTALVRLGRSPYRPFCDLFRLERRARLWGMALSRSGGRTDPKRIDTQTEFTGWDGAMIERIEANDSLLAIVLRADYSSPGIQFFTPGEFSQQLAYMRHPPGKAIDPHYHNPAPREVTLTQEVLFVRSGRVRVDLFDDEQVFVKSLELAAGDVILLASGGHGFEMLEETEMIEVKQGPYLGDSDKTRFRGRHAGQEPRGE